MSFEVGLKSALNPISDFQTFWNESKKGSHLSALFIGIIKTLGYLLVVPALVGWAILLGCRIKRSVSNAQTKVNSPEKQHSLARKILNVLHEEARMDVVGFIQDLNPQYQVIQGALKEDDIEIQEVDKRPMAPKNYVIRTRINDKEDAYQVQFRAHGETFIEGKKHITQGGFYLIMNGKETLIPMDDSIINEDPRSKHSKLSPFIKKVILSAAVEEMRQSAKELNCGMQQEYDEFLADQSDNNPYK